MDVIEVGRTGGIRDVGMCFFFKKEHLSLLASMDLGVIG